MSPPFPISTPPGAREWLGELIAWALAQPEATYPFVLGALCSQSSLESLPQEACERLVDNYPRVYPRVAKGLASGL